MAANNPLLNDPSMAHYPPTPTPLHEPPPLCHDPSPYARIPLPPVHDHGDQCHTTLISIHPLLRYSLEPVIQFDLHHHPSTITLPPGSRQQHSLSEPATHPSLPCLNVSTRLLPYSIVVLPSQPHLPHSFVTVYDVLRTLHRALSLCVDHDELHELPSPDVRSQVEAVYEHRVRAHPDGRTRESEKRWGIRRIDLLLGQTRFLGLSIAGKRRDVLVLDVC